MANGEDIFLFNNNLLTGGSPYLADTVPFSQFILHDNGQLQVDYTLRHPDQMSEFGQGTELTSQSFTSLLHVYLGARMYHKNGNDVTPEEWKDFGVGIKDGSAAISVGGDMWVLSKGYREFVVDYTVASKDPLFQKTDEFYWKVMVVDGQLVAFIATPEPNKLSDRDMRIMAFAPMWEVILNDPFTPGQRITSFWSGPVTKAAAQWSQLGGGANKTYPNVTVQPTTNFLEVDYPK